MLTPAARRALLDIARASVRAAAGDPAPLPPEPRNPDLLQPGAAFVTLRREGELRGCIGHVRHEQPLWISVREMAEAAATRDGRFSPVSSYEVPHLSIEISVLSPRRKIAGPGDISVGRDGLYVRLGATSGLLLPQVASERNWSSEEFLAQTCRKAMLPADAWREPGAIVEAFSAEVFGDEISG
jgi:AmmeMemoRadiSam system protein A